MSPNRSVDPSSGLSANCSWREGQRGAQAQGRRKWERKGERIGVESEVSCRPHEKTERNTHVLHEGLIWYEHRLDVRGRSCYRTRAVSPSERPEIGDPSSLELLHTVVYPAVETIEDVRHDVHPLTPIFDLEFGPSSLGALVQEVLRSVERHGARGVRILVTQLYRRCEQPLKMGYLLFFSMWIHQEDLPTASFTPPKDVQSPASPRHDVFRCAT